MLKLWNQQCYMNVFFEVIVETKNPKAPPMAVYKKCRTCFPNKKTLLLLSPCKD